MQTYLPTLKQLQYLVALKEHGHFGRAADASNVTQSTLSAGIRELETLLGMMLVERTRRVVRFTPLGDRIVERALEDAYASLSSILQSRISKELYSYLALLLAGTNRPTLLAVLEEQLEQDIRRRPAILEALRVRTTPEQAAILKRWEDGAGAD